MSEPKVFEGIDWGKAPDRGYFVVSIGPDPTPETVQAFRDAYDLGCAWAEAVAALGPTAWLRVEGPHDAPHDDWYDVEAVDWTDGLVAIVTLASETGPLPAALRAVVEKLREREG